MNEQTSSKDQTYQVPEIFMPRLEEYVTKLQRRAARLNVAPIAIIEHKRETHTVEHISFDVLTISIEGTSPILNGWEFAATIEHGEAKDGRTINVIRSTPFGEEPIPVAFRTIDKTCDHCKAKRTRKDTYIVRNVDTNEFKQVGSTCIRDYVGHKSARSVANYLDQCLALLEDLLGDDFSIEEALEKIFAHMRSGRENGMQIEFRFDLHHFLLFTVRAIHHYGWISKGKAYNSHSLIATATRASDALFDSMDPKARKYKDLKLCQPVSNERELVDGAIEWASELSDDDLRSDYLANLNAIALQETITWKSFGIAASMIAAYQRTISEQQERKERPESKHFGEIKKRYEFVQLTLKREHVFEGYYGATYIYTFEDAQGNVFVWFTGNSWYEVGITYTGRATVKAHEEYKGIAQTVITRASLKEVE